MRVATASATPAATVSRGWRSASMICSVVTRRMRWARSAGVSRRRGSCAPRVRMRRGRQDRPQPRLVRRRTEREPRRVDAIELIAQPIGEPAFLDLQVLDQPASVPAAE